MSGESIITCGSIVMEIMTIMNCVLCKELIIVIIDEANYYSHTMELIM